MNSKLFAILLFCLVTTAYYCWPLILFTEEHIALILHPDMIEVDGTYRYHNPYPFPVPMGFSIPFPIDESHPHPVLIDVSMVNEGTEALPLRTVGGKLRFDLLFMPRETKLVNLRYQQYADDLSGEYILTTTAPWKRPLERAWYTVKTEGVLLTDSNYPLSASDDADFGFYRESFMPQENWKLQWKVLE